MREVENVGGKPEVPKTNAEREEPDHDATDLARGRAFVIGELRLRALAHRGRIADEAGRSVDVQVADALRRHFLGGRRRIWEVDRVEVKRSPEQTGMSARFALQAQPVGLEEVGGKARREDAKGGRGRADRRLLFGRL